MWSILPFVPVMPISLASPTFSNSSSMSPITGLPAARAACAAGWG